MTLMFLSIILTLVNDVLADYKMEPYITCFEQNQENPITRSYKDPVYSDMNSSTCIDYPSICETYQNEEPYAGKGDVCSKYKFSQNKLIYICIVYN